MPGPLVGIESINYLYGTNTTIIPITWEDSSLWFGASASYNASANSTEEVPDAVCLNVLDPDGIGITSYEMDIGSWVYYDGTYVADWSYYYERNMTEYHCPIEFGDEYAITEDTTLYYYYEAEYADGSRSQLWNVESEDSSGDGEIDTYTNSWFGIGILKRAAPGSNAPRIIGYDVKDITNGAYWDNYFDDSINYFMDDILDYLFPIGPIFDESVLRFTLYMQDPDATHEEHYEYDDYEFKPTLTLSRRSGLSNDAELEMMWSGAEYAFGTEFGLVDTYVVDLLGTGDWCNDWGEGSIISSSFGPGLWTFNFEVQDNQSHTVNKLCSHIYNTDDMFPNHQIWHIGSLNNLRTSFMAGPGGMAATGGMSTGISLLDVPLQFIGTVQPLITSVGLLVAAIAQYFGEKGRAVAAAVGGAVAGIQIGLSTAGVVASVAGNDPGSCLGLSLYGLMQSCLYAASSKLISIFKSASSSLTDSAKNVRGKMSIWNLGIVGKGVELLALLGMFQSLVNNPLNTLMWFMMYKMAGSSLSKTTKTIGSTVLFGLNWLLSSMMTSCGIDFTIPMLTMLTGSEGAALGMEQLLNFANPMILTNMLTGLGVGLTVGIYDLAVKEKNTVKSIFGMMSMMQGLLTMISLGSFIVQTDMFYFLPDFVATMMFLTPMPFKLLADSLD